MHRAIEGNLMPDNQIFVEYGLFLHCQITQLLLYSVLDRRDSNLDVMTSAQLYIDI